MSFDWAFIRTISGQLLTVGLPLTLKIGVASFGIGLLLAVLINVVYFYRVPVLRQFFQLYVSFFRGTPVILHLYLAYYFLPLVLETGLGRVGITFAGSSLSPVTLAIVALSLGISSYLSETLRSALNQLNSGEFEAAVVFGLPYHVIVRRLLVPQVLRLSVPNLATQLISVIQGSSLAFYISVLELTGTARILAQDNWKYFEVFVASGLIYWGVAGVIEVLSHLLEGRLDIARKIKRKQKMLGGL